MGENVEDVLSAPPGLHVIEAILGKSAGIEDAELRANARKIEGGWLTAIVEPGPKEDARGIRPLRVVLPSDFGVATGRAIFLGCEVRLGAIVEINSARCLRRRFLGCYNHLPRELGV